MKKIRSFILPTLIAAGAACLTGCFSVQKVTLKNTGEEHVVMNTYGWRLFDCIPLGSGNADVDAVSPTAFFRDDVTVEKMQRRFVAYAEGRKIESPVYDLNDTVIFYVFGIPIPYVVTYKEITLSGTLK